jgi:hypothetical protein
MDSKNLKPWQARIIRTPVHRALGYLTRLRTRMERRGFAPDDKLLQLTAKAHDALLALSVELYYMSCESGVGREKPTEKT